MSLFALKQTYCPRPVVSKLQLANSLQDPVTHRQGLQSSQLVFRGGLMGQVYILAGRATGQMCWVALLVGVCHREHCLEQIHMAAGW